MALVDAIRGEVQANRIPPHWTTGDLVRNGALSGAYAKTTLQTDPPNRSASSIGQQLGTGVSAEFLNPRFYRVGRRDGAMLYALPEHVDLMTSASAVVYAEAGILDDPIEEDDSAIGIGGGRETDETLPPTCAPLNNQAITALTELAISIEEDEPWDTRLRDYRWGKRSFFETQDDLADTIWRGSVLSRLIVSRHEWTARDQREAVRWANEIFKWGRTPQKLPVTWEKGHAVLGNALANANVSAAAPMNSGYTKVASLGAAFVEETKGNIGSPQVINDSRVATSLTFRLDAILQHQTFENATPRATFPGLGTVDVGRGGTRPRLLRLDWPRAYGSWRGQFAATRAVVKIRDILNGGATFPRMPTREDQVSAWTLRGVEAVLFMDGY